MKRKYSIGSGKETIEVPKIIYNKKILNVYKISFNIKCEMSSSVGDSKN